MRTNSFFTFGSFFAGYALLVGCGGSTTYLNSSPDADATDTLPDSQNATSIGDSRASVDAFSNGDATSATDSATGLDARTDASTTIDAATDASTAIDAATDASTAIDAATDASTTIDSTTDSATVIDATAAKDATLDSTPGDAGSDAAPSDVIVDSVTCGSVGEPCCTTGAACAGTNAVCKSKVCAPCGGPGDSCCANNACNTGYQCATGQIWRGCCGCGVRRREPSLLPNGRRVCACRVSMHGRDGRQRGNVHAMWGRQSSLLCGQRRARWRYLQRRLHVWHRQCVRRVRFCGQSLLRGHRRSGRHVRRRLAMRGGQRHLRDVRCGRRAMLRRCRGHWNRRYVHRSQ